jgi:hypothetical protein
VKAVFSLTANNISKNIHYLNRAGTFKNLIRLVMEFKLGLYDKCWSCGEQSKIDKKGKYTAKGFPKYHFQCNNDECREFWVKNHCAKHGYKIVKLSLDTEWYVVCPTWGDGYQFERRSEN